MKKLTNIGEISIDLKAISTGLYYIKICNNSNVTLQKLTIIKNEQ